MIWKMQTPSSCWPNLSFQDTSQKQQVHIKMQESLYENFNERNTSFSDIVIKSLSM